MFFVLRVLICLLIFAIGLVFIIISKISKKKKWILSIILAVMMIAVSSVLMFFPIENAFITFSSPEDAYRYNHRENLALNVEGKTTDYMIGIEDQNTINICIYPKDETGWKLGLGSDVNIVYNTIEDSNTIHIYQYKNKEEYYISVLPIDKNELIEISDNHQSAFYHLEHYQTYLKQPYYTYYAYIGDLSQSYTLTIDENIYQLDIQK